MNVNEIRDRILEVSHNEIAPDTDLKNKALSWLNSAYHEMISSCLPYLERFLETMVSVDVSNKQVALPTNLYRILKVVNEGTGEVLVQKSLSDIASINNIENADDIYWVDGDTLFVSSSSITKLKIVYLKQVDDLVDGGDVNSVLLPLQFHHALVWGGLVWSSIFERGFGTQADIKVFQQKWDDAKREVKLSLSNQPAKGLNVMPYDIF